MSKGVKSTILNVTYPDRGAGDDPEAWWLAFDQGPTFMNAYCQAATNLVDQG